MHTKLPLYLCRVVCAVVSKLYKRTKNKSLARVEKHAERVSESSMCRNDLEERDESWEAITECPLRLDRANSPDLRSPPGLYILKTSIDARRCLLLSRNL